MLHDQATKEHDFFFKIKHDEDGRFYDLICAPFFGINNHRRNIMFAYAFLVDEKTGSFQWLFEVFNK